MWEGWREIRDSWSTEGLGWAELEAATGSTTEGLVIHSRSLDLTLRAAGATRSDLPFREKSLTAA